MENDVRLDGISDLSRIESADGSDVCYRLFDSMYDGMGLFELRDGKVRAMYLNNRYFDVVGYTKEQYRPYLDNVTVTLFEEDEKRFMENTLKNAGIDHDSSFEVRGYRADGSVGWFCIRSRTVDYVKCDNPVYLAAIYDCTAAKRLEQSAKINKERYRILEETGTNYLLDYDPEGDEMIVSPGRDMDERKYINYARHVGNSDIIHPADSAYFYVVLLKACRREHRGYVDIRITDKNGGWIPVRVVYSGVADDGDNVIKILGRVDVKGGNEGNENPLIYCSEGFDTLLRKESAAGISFISRQLENCPRNASLLLADIDDMRVFNREVSFDEGSAALLGFEKAAAAIFGSGTVFRYMGDIFVIYTEGLSENELYLLIDRLRTAAGNIDCGGKKRALNFSVGIARIKDCCGREGVGDLLITAAHGLYRAKKEGKNSLVIENAAFPKQEAR